MNPDIQKLALERFLSFLHSKGARKTPERILILEQIYRIKGHFGVDILYQKVQGVFPSISLATVYNTLELLLEAKLVVKLQFGGNLSYYEASLGSKQHDHLMCNQCNRLIEFCDPGIQQIKTQMGELLNFTITQHALILYGDCKNEQCEFRNDSSVSVPIETK